MLYFLFIFNFLILMAIFAILFNGFRCMYDNREKVYYLLFLTILLIITLMTTYNVYLIENSIKYRYDIKKV
jgi:hypothetical protein